MPPAAGSLRPRDHHRRPVRQGASPHTRADTPGSQGTTGDRDERARRSGRPPVSTITKQVAPLGGSGSEVGVSPLLLTVAADFDDARTAYAERTTKLVLRRNSLT